ncbi:MAG: DUF4190 domain-containing protein [Micrococcales bacterium]|nr:DUF4190 domain-containing protein [Micrococcales bacterium]
MAEATKYDFTKLNTLAVVSLASAITLFGAPAAFVTGFLALAQIKQSQEKGRWMAITGIVLAGLAVALGVLLSIASVWLRSKYGDGHMNDDRFWNDGPYGQDDWRMPGQN